MERTYERFDLPQPWLGRAEGEPVLCPYCHWPWSLHWPYRPGQESPHNVVWCGMTWPRTRLEDRGGVINFVVYGTGTSLDGTIDHSTTLEQAMGSDIMEVARERARAKDEREALAWEQEHDRATVIELNRLRRPTEVREW